MARKGLVALLLGAALMIGAQPASAQDIRAGDRVYAAQTADLKVEADVVATAQKDDVLSVREISGKWLWVETIGGERGWIDQQFVKLTPPPPTIDLSPQPAPTTPTPQPATTTPTPQPATTTPTPQPATTTPTPQPTTLTPRPGSAISRPAAPAESPQPSGNTESTTDAAELESNLLLAVGALSGQNVYVTYAYIGTVADGYANQVYSAEQVQELMREIVGLCSTAGGYVRTLAAADISEDDRASVEQMVGILDLLRQEAEALSAFVVSESQEDLTAYETARAAAWPQIQGALGIR